MVIYFYLFFLNYWPKIEVCFSKNWIFWLAGKSAVSQTPVSMAENLRTPCRVGHPEAAYPRNSVSEIIRKKTLVPVAEHLNNLDGLL